MNFNMADDQINGVFELKPDDLLSDKEESIDTLSQEEQDTMNTLCDKPEDENKDEDEVGQQHEDMRSVNR